MTMPTPQEARSRQTAMEAERHWWVSKLRERIAELEPCASYPTEHGEWAQGQIDALEALIAERTR